MTEGWVYPTEVIAENVGCSIPTAERILNRLCDESIDPADPELMACFGVE
jgi:hypothetical protein